LLTKELSRSITFFSALFLGALLWGNIVVLYVALVPLLFTIMGLMINTPSSIIVERKEMGYTVWKDEIITMRVEVSIRGGLGLVTVADRLPPYFELIEGNNFHVFWKGIRDVSASFSYKVRCTKRGLHTFDGLQWRSRHLLGLQEPIVGEEEDPPEVLVKTKIMNIRRIRGIRGIASSPFPIVDIARMGVSTTDFREIREYMPGDPIRNINWKATARYNAGYTVKPLVNEYEAEGKKAVWIFLDGSSEMEIGSTIENVFEYAVEVAEGVAYYFLEKNYRVGMYIYNKEGNQLLYPDTGMRQFYKISRELNKIETTSRKEDLKDAVEKCRGYLLSYNPLCVVIPEFSEERKESLRKGIKSIIKLIGRRRKKPPIMLVNIPPYYLSSGDGQYREKALKLIKMRERPLVKTFESMGISILRWNPRKESFATALLRGVKR